MTDRLSVEQILHKLYAARSSGALEPLCSLFAPDVDFRIIGTSEGKPISITARGIIAVRPWLAMLVKTFRFSDHRIHRMLIDGKHAAVHWNAIIHSRITGSIVPTELVDIMEIRDTGIISYTEFFVPTAVTPDADKAP